MNFREISTRALYLLFTLGSLGAGIWLLVDPVGSNAALHIQPGDTANGALNDPLLRKLGAAYLCTSLVFLWCLRRADVRKTIQPVLVLFFGLIAAIELAELAAAGEPSLEWLTIAPLALLPPIILALMLVPLPAMPSMPSMKSSGGETGVVKWFDTRKGFGFITRANGEELFVHYRSISGSGSGPRALRDGQPVRFRVGEGKKGPQAEDVVPIGKKA